MIRHLCLALLAACALPFAAMAQGGPPQDTYIVVLNEGLDLPEDVAADVAIRTGGRVGYVYEHAVRGFSITMPRAALARVERDPRVAYVEEDIPISIVAQDVPTGIQRIFADDNDNLDIDGTDDYRVDVDVAVLDTGIDIDHPELDVVGGANCLQSSGGGPPWMRNYYCDDSAPFDDDHYHGTHVAGTIGAIDNGAGVVGVAPGARLWAVKVLDSSGSGYISGIVAGIECVIAPTATCSLGDIEVINMSLGGSGTSTAMNEAISNAVDAGITVVVAAGNSDADASGFTPANAADAITVSALSDSDGAPGGTGGPPSCRTSEGDDVLANFSNWGTTIEIAAPGVCILSTYPIEKGEYGKISGTSMASPHVAGAAAILASGGNAPAGRSGVMAIWDDLFGGADGSDCSDLADIGTGNCDWTDDSGDGVQEPLLDVSTFTAAVVGGGSSVGGSDTAPNVSVASPSDGATVSGTVTIQVDASDTEDSTGSLTVEVAINGGGWQSATYNSTSGYYELTWNTGDGSDGSYTIDARATDTGTNTTNATQVTVTVDNSGPVGALDVTGVTPNSVQAGSSVDVTISGTGFAAGASVSLENGNGPAPSASNVVVVDSTTITATITASSGGPPRNRAWDLRVTNPDSSSDVLPGGFTVTP